MKFLLAQAALTLLGAGAAWHPSARGLSVAGRAAVAFGAGAVALTIEATLFSLLGIPWSLSGLALPLLLLSGAAAARWKRLPARERERAPVRRGVALWACLAGGVAVLYLGLSFASSAAGSADFLFFWGVKAIRFAEDRGLSAEFLRHPFTVHASRDYPPLVPIVQAWGCLAAGRMPWRIVPLFSGLWVLAAIPILFERCRLRLGADAAAAVTAFWTVAMSVSLVNSFSAGSAEAPLVFFETVALAWLLTERDPGESRFVPTVALCGAALTKVEGLLAVILIAAGLYFRDRVRGRVSAAGKSLQLAAWPAATVGLWFAYQRSQSLEVGYRGHGELLSVYTDFLGVILETFWRNLDAGSLGLAWVFAAVFLLSRARAWRAVAPALVLAAGLATFLVFDYLHDTDDPSRRIGWTAPRVIQPALSAAILAAGVLSFSRRRPEEPAGRPV